ncbi:hypothetical protein DPEC_G00103680 [Dallia pectoralis]|uniref:Uncharacterized protein n=1 Tax=Dallia pectoralis TaxID=75939 RepID=A0ACC2GXF0_DALPE|nr:hypothetical protein DPEC_G00103680 [Dallia pectoralis]
MMSHKMERRTLLPWIHNPSRNSRTILVSKILALVIPSAQIAIGVWYLNDCPQQRYIPIYLVVMGAIGLVLALLSEIPRAEDSGSRNPNLLGCIFWNILTSLFLFCWFISGNVWIYSIYQPNYNQTQSNYNQSQFNYNQTLTEKLYCNRTLYLFAFWINTTPFDSIDTKGADLKEPQTMETSHRSSVLISIIVVLNITVWMILMSAVGLGAMHLNDCPIQPRIPVYLLVIGVTSIVSLLLSYLLNTLEPGTLSLLMSSCVILLQLFNLAWFITGSVWVYSIFPLNYDSTNGEKNCQRTLYLFAFWFNSLGVICLAVVAACGVYFVILICIKTAFRGHHLFYSHNRLYCVDA